MLLKTNKKTKDGRDIYLDGNKEVTLLRVGGKHQNKIPNNVFGIFRKPQPQGQKDTSLIVVKPIRKIRIDGNKFIVYQ